MNKKNQQSDREVDRKTTADQKDAPTDKGVNDMRKANENIRKGQGDDAGQQPTIDRHR